MALTPKHERLNRALDESLSGAELAEFQAFLEADQEEAALYARLRNVDEVLRQPPMAKPSPDFSRKLMMRIEAGDHKAYAPHNRLTRLLLWGGVVSVVAVPLLLVLMVVVPALVAPGMFMDMFQGFVQTLGTVTGVVNGLLTFLSDLIARYPMAPALALMVIPVVMIWAWLVWYLQQQNRPATIVIKVQSVGSRS